ncbi:hypothetical protein GCM10023081_42890 [Arthrobacter ginkgonis]|uniref:NERD domain-containing protein n=1 Tax=Arthrobacter ginkgonis TaxID=1630594 RepID=A0ABP7DBC4_9MICC
MESSSRTLAADGPGPAWDLRDRIPGQAVIGQLLDIQQEAPTRNWFARFFGANPLSLDALPWYRGALGEIRVARLLEGLGPEWTVLHAVPVGAGSSDIDHVVIGPTGAFTLNTKNHSGQTVWVAGNTVLVAGRKQPYIPAAVHEAARAEKLLSAATGEEVLVSGMIVIVGAKSLTIKVKTEGAIVLSDQQLVRRLKRRKRVLSPAQIATFSAAAIRPNTWHVRPPAEMHTDVAQEFRELRRLVDSARRRRALWATVLLAAGFATLANLVPAAIEAVPRVLLNQ